MNFGAYFGPENLSTRKKPKTGIPFHDHMFKTSQKNDKNEVA